MQRVAPGIGDSFVPVKEDLREKILPALFQVPGEGTPGIGITCLPVNQVGLSLPDPIKTALNNLTVSYFITGHFDVAIRGKE